MTQPAAPQMPRYPLSRAIRSFTIGTLVGLGMMALFTPEAIPYFTKAWRQAHAAEAAFNANRGKDRQADCQAAQGVALAWHQAKDPEKTKTWQGIADNICHGPVLPN